MAFQGNLHGESKEHPEECSNFKPSNDKTSTGCSNVELMSGPPSEANIPGKPSAERVFSDSVDIVWGGVSNFGEGDAYQVRIENTQTGHWDSKFFEKNRGNIGDLQAGATYVLKVRLVKATGEESKYSENSEEFKIKEDRPGKPITKRVLVDGIDIEWDGVRIFGDKDAYQVCIINPQTGKRDYKFFKVNNANIRGLLPGTTYVFKVRLVKGNGEESEYSENSDEVTTKQKPKTEASIPGKPYAERVFSDSVDIVWEGVRNFSEGDAYQIRIENTQTGQWDSKFFEKNRGNIGDLQAGATYVLKVRLVKATGEEYKYSENSEEFKIKEVRPGKPVVKRVFVDSVDIEWDGVQIFREEDAYQVFITNNKTKMSDSKLFKVNSGNIGGLMSGTPYIFKVRFVKANGEESEYSENSDEVTTNEESKKEKNRPGKPIVQEIYTDSVDIKWDRIEEFHKGDHYQVRVETVPEGISDFQNFEISNVKIKGLKPNKSYIFKVRWVKRDGDKSPYSDESDTITTPMSFAAQLVRYSKPVTTDSGKLDIYELPLNELLDARNEITNSKKYEIGHRKMNGIHEKTIMLVGATGSGKSTFVDVLANFVLGVRCDDPFRFTVMGKEDREKKKDQTKSQTDFISCYSFNKEAGTRLAFRLNVIDTPGFGDVRGKERDKTTVTQFRQLFEDTGIKGIETIDAVCFLLKASDARLTECQKYIFNEVTSLFARDFSENLCAIITFADGMEDPPVLAAVKAEGLSFGNTFQFNNSGLYSNPRKNQIISMFWDIRLQSLDAMFSHVNTLNPKSIQLSTEVLNKRQTLETDYKELLTKIGQGLKHVDMLNKMMTLFKNNEKEIEENKNFKAEICEEKVIKVDLHFFKKATNCSSCKRTCHYDCWLVEYMKGSCSVIDWDTGYCTVCKCYGDNHKRTSYTYETKQETKMTTYKDMRERYEKALGEKLNLEQMLDAMEKNIATMAVGVKDMLNKMNICNDRLNKIALRPTLPKMSNPIEAIIDCKLIDGKKLCDSEVGILKKIRDIANGKVVQQDTDDKRPYWNYFNSK